MAGSKNDRNIVSMFFRALAQIKMQTTSSRIWTQVADSFLFTDNRLAKFATSTIEMPMNKTGILQLISFYLQPKKYLSPNFYWSKLYLFLTKI